MAIKILLAAAWNFVLRVPIIKGEGGRRSVVVFGHGFSEAESAANQRQKSLNIKGFA